MAWFLPGISAPAVLLGAFVLTYGRSGGQWIGPALLGGLLVLTIGCGVFDALLRLPPRGETDDSRPRRLAKHTSLFVLAQVLVVPVLGTGTAYACTTVIRFAN